MGMDSVVWLVAVVAFFILEAITTALVSVWFAVGAAVALIVSFFTTSVAVQFVVFALVSAVTLAIMVPLLAKHRGQNAPITNGARLSVGKRGIVLLAILPGEIGRVRVDGLDWQARAEVPMPKDTPCRVTDVDVAVLIVCPVTVQTATA